MPVNNRGSEIYSDIERYSLVSVILVVSISHSERELQC